MSERITLSVVSIVMLVFSMQNRDWKSILMTLGLTLGILISWMRFPFIVNSAFFLYPITALLIAIFSLFNQKLSSLYRGFTFLIGIWSVCMMLNRIMHWPYYGGLMLFTLIPLACYSFMLGRGLFYKNEFPYISILSTGLLLDLLSFWGI